MRQVSYNKCGGPSVLEYTASAKVPTLKPNSQTVLVKVHASAVNPVDWKIRLINTPGRPLPKVPGSDFAGEIVETSSSNSVFKKGDKVFGMLPLLEAQGSCQDFITISEKLVSKMPDNLSFNEAASLPLVSLTAWQAFSKTTLLDSFLNKEKKFTKQKVLIHAGAGGVGSVAIQIASKLGHKVFTTCSTKNVEFCRSLGVFRVIDYTKEKFEGLGEMFDVILDTIGGNYELASMKCIRADGTYLNIMNSGWATKWATGKSDGVSGADSQIGTLIGFAYAAFRMTVQYISGPYYKFCLVKPSGTQLSQISDFFQQYKVKPNIDSVFALQNVEKAHEYMEKGHARGKVVIDLDLKAEAKM